MLTEATLIEAIQAADKATAVCGRLCRYGAAIEDGKYHIHHNGLGNSDSDDIVVWADGTLQLGQAPLTEILSTWLATLHGHKRYDLNERKEI